MCKFKIRFLAAFLTFGIGLLGVSLWLIKPSVIQHPSDKRMEIIEAEPEIRGFNEVVSAKDGTYVTVQGWIDPKFLCRDEPDLEQIICTTALVGQSPAEKSMYIQLWKCSELIKSNCIVHNQTQSPDNAKLYDNNSNRIDHNHQIKITGRVSVIEGKGKFRNPIGKIESIDSSQKATTPLSQIDLSKIGHTAPKGRLQDLDYNQLKVIEDLISNGKESIPFLINQLTVEKKIKGHVKDYWNEVKVGDVAFFILTDFFTDGSWERSTIEGASFNEFLGCNDPKLPADYCYYNYIEKHGRKNIKARWQKIWKENKDKIYWDEAERCFRLKA